MRVKMYTRNVIVVGIIFIIIIISAVVNLFNKQKETVVREDLQEIINNKGNLFEVAYLPEGFIIDNQAVSINYIKEIQGEYYAEYDIDEYCNVENDPSLFCDTFETGKAVAVTNGSGTITITTYYAYDSDAGNAYVDEVKGYIGDNSISCGGGALTNANRTVYMNVIGNPSLNSTARQIIEEIKSDTGFEVVYYCTGEALSFANLSP